MLYLWVINWDAKRKTVARKASCRPRQAISVKFDYTTKGLKGSVDIAARSRHCFLNMFQYRLNSLPLKWKQVKIEKHKDNLRIEFRRIMKQAAPFPKYQSPPEEKYAY